MLRLISMKQLEQILERGENVLLLDVRTSEEFRRGHLSGAVNIPVEELDERAWDVQRMLNERDVLQRWNVSVIVYCSHGSKSLQAAQILDACGFYVLAAAGGLASYRGRHYKSI